jgi:Protein of unknown function (DUF2793)
MTDPISYTSTSPRFALPFLFTAQAQKEFFVNEAFARLDALLHPVVEGEANTPPTSPVDGQSWVVGTAPTGAWIGHAGEIASRQSGQWLFAEPAAGMQVFDKAAGRFAVYGTAWARASAVAVPTGGTAIDAEARTAISGLIAALVTAGILN